MPLQHRRQQKFQWNVENVSGTDTHSSILQLYSPLAHSVLCEQITTHIVDIKSTTRAEKLDVLEENIEVDVKM